MGNESQYFGNRNEGVAAQSNVCSAICYKKEEEKKRARSLRSRTKGDVGRRAFTGKAWDDLTGDHRLAPRL